MTDTSRVQPDRVIVLGAGAIGAAVGAMLFEVGVPVTLVARGEHGRVLAERGVDLRFPGGSRQVRVPVGPLGGPTPGDLVILATMGQHTEAAIDGLDPRVPVASFQNGTAALELVARRGHPTIAAMLWVPAERRAPGVVALPGDPVPGVILLGPGPHAHWLAGRLVAAGLRAEVEPDIGPWILAKQLVNIGGVVVALCDRPPRAVIEGARDEARRVWRAAGLPFRTLDELLARVGPLSQAPVDGRERQGGSTRSALDRGEPLETASLNGSIVTLGRCLGIPTPVNEALIREAERAVAEGRRPGTLAGEELEARIFASG